jgi:hypothetical protein
MNIHSQTNTKQVFEEPTSMRPVSKRNRWLVYVVVTSAACAWAALGGLLFGRPSVPELSLHVPYRWHEPAVRTKPVELPAPTPAAAPVSPAPVPTPPPIAAKVSSRVSVSVNAKPRVAQAPRRHRAKARAGSTTATQSNRNTARDAWQSEHVDYSPYVSSPAARPVADALDHMQLR